MIAKCDILTGVSNISVMNFILNPHIESDIQGTMHRDVFLK